MQLVAQRRQRLPPVAFRVAGFRFLQDSCDYTGNKEKTVRESSRARTFTCIGVIGTAASPSAASAGPANDVCGLAAPLLAAVFGGDA